MALTCDLEPDRLVSARDALYAADGVDRGSIIPVSGLSCGIISSHWLGWLFAAKSAGFCVRWVQLLDDKYQRACGEALQGVQCFPALPDDSYLEVDVIFVHGRGLSPSHPAWRAGRLRAIIWEQASRRPPPPGWRLCNSWWIDHAHVGGVTDGKSRLYMALRNLPDVGPCPQLSRRDLGSVLSSIGSGAVAPAPLVPRPWPPMVID